MSLKLLLLPPLFAVVNRVRGGGFYGHYLPGHPRLWVSAFVALLVAALSGVKIGLLAGLCYFLWSLPPWGRWYSLGNMPREASGAPDAFEKVLEWLVDKTVGRYTNRRGYLDFACFGARNALCLIPLAFLSPLAAVIVWLGQQLSYAVAWALSHPGQIPISYAEMGTGLFWGLALAVLTT